MKMLYQDFAKKGLGVADSDYKNTVEKVAGTSYRDIYNNYIHGAIDYTALLKSSLAYIGCNLSITPSRNYHESNLGFKIRYENGVCKIDNIFPGSTAEQKGLSINDEIIAINGIQLNNDLELWGNYFKDKEIGLSVKRALGTITKVTFDAKTKSLGFKDYKIVRDDLKNENFKKWA